MGSAPWTESWVAVEYATSRLVLLLPGTTETISGGERLPSTAAAGVGINMAPIAATIAPEITAREEPRMYFSLNQNTSVHTP